mmetsp:Transcript_36815/g.41975  ORF Transcript_36815/g.41975 Transcript_36815/m.41975 type:complete len:242 (-) Transcript_36815:331-1056(-)|eukprot:CAMPEP_0194146752 /NCGR_PEP_ID=MMETSP0152-20130528/21575_1 /TAXON_ID=1049557 /ORGANISM="Thalassiothrix antarctica, Strain L6-D1" /LENGTH=241 /DNA_ID=CAMNT_0038847343 /DNA_START=320 /DNA_END=1045 /DNA_ORIENTATION=-
MSDKAMEEMAKLVNKFIQMPDAEPFRVAVDYKGLGLFDYPEIVNKPMDLGTIKKKLSSKSQYRDVFKVAEDVRLVWTNCMMYNADGSDFYILAQNLAKKFEDKLKKLIEEHSLVEGGNNINNNDDKNQDKPKSKDSKEASDLVSLDEKKAFAKSLYKLTKDEVGRILVELDQKCPAALVKNSSEDEVELNIDKITPEIFNELVTFANGCISSHQGSSGGKGGKNSKSSSKSKTTSKKARTS